MKGTINVYLSPYSQLKVCDLNDETSPNSLVFATKLTKDYTLVGTAEVTVTLASHADIVGAKVEALRAELQTVRAVAQSRANEIEGAIQNLMAITNEVTS